MTTAPSRWNLVRRSDRASRRGAPGRAGVVLLLLAVCAAAASAQVRVRRVALTGESAPGLDPGVRFSAFTTPLNHSIMTPQIDDDGNVAFITFLTGNGVDFSNHMGIWSEAGGALSLVVRQGDAAPGTEEDTVFAGIPNSEVPFPPAVASGQVGFFGALSGPDVEFVNDGGVWIHNGELGLLLREDDPVPGVPADVRFASFGVLGLDNSGAVYLATSFTGAGIDTDNDDAVWVSRDGVLEPVVLEGQDAPGTDVQFARGELGSFRVFPQTRFNSESQVVLEATVNGPGVNSFNDEALFLESRDSGELELLLREGDPAPGLDEGVTFGGNSVSLSVIGLTIDDAGATGFNLRLGGALPTTTAMYSTRSGALAPEVLPGDPAPGTDAEFLLFGAPTLNGAGRIAFRAAIDGGFFPPFGIWWDESGTLAPLVLAGDVVDTRLGTQIVNGTSFIAGYSSAGELGFVAGLEDAVTGEFRNALLLAGPDEVLELVAATGELFDVGGDGSDRREVVRVTHGRLNAMGAMAFRLDFSDGSSGHFVADGGEQVAPDLSFVGSCPGTLTLTITGLTPGGAVALAGADQAGETPIPGGPCAGVLLDLDSPTLLATRAADGSGEITLERDVPAGACGRSLQAIDLVTCATSNVITLP